MDLVSAGIDLRFPISCCGRYIGYLYLYHDGSPSGSLFSPIVFLDWMLVTWGLWANVRYRYGILMALTYDLWDDYLLRFIDGVLDEFTAGFMSHCTPVSYTHLRAHET